MNEERMNELTKIRNNAVREVELIIYNDLFSSAYKVNELTDRLLTVKDDEKSGINLIIFRFFDGLHAKNCEIEDVLPAKQALATELVDLYQQEAKRYARELAEEAVNISWATAYGEFIKV